MENIKVYVGDDSKLHFVDSGGADSVLPFSQSLNILEITSKQAGGSITVDGNVLLAGIISATYNGNSYYTSYAHSWSVSPSITWSGLSIVRRNLEI